MISNNHDKSVKHVFSVFPYSFFSVFNHIPFIPGLVSLHSWLSILSLFLALVSSSWPCVPSFLAQYSFRIPGPCLLLLALCPFIPGSVFFPYSWPLSPPPGLVSLHSWLSILSVFLAFVPSLLAAETFVNVELQRHPTE